MASLIKQQQQQARESGTLRIKSLFTLATTRIKFIRIKFTRKLFEKLFYIHFIPISTLTIALTIRGLILIFIIKTDHHFHPSKWYPPLLVATACATIISLAWQQFTSYNPSAAIKLAFYFTPLFTCSAGIVLVLIGSHLSLAIGVIAVVSSIIISIYTCWITPRFDYAVKILYVSVAFPPPGTPTLVLLSLLMALSYWVFLMLGIGGATANGSDFDAVFILFSLLSLSWTMQVIKNVVFVTISRIRYINFASGMDMETPIACRETLKYLINNIVIGSMLVPILGVVRGSARIINLVAGGHDEFLFSCANCYLEAASTLITYGNRWGFVHVGVYDKGFVQASKDTWNLFRVGGMEQLIDSDLTGSFCFLSGLAGGALSSVVGGTWALVIRDKKSYATEVSLYAFVIGYFMKTRRPAAQSVAGHFKITNRSLKVIDSTPEVVVQPSKVASYGFRMCRIAMAWPQACVSAYYVAYAENPLNPRFDSAIRTQIHQIQRSMA
ncbi:hypothetical protein ACFE04_027901 [Oxalis oulophora]